MKNKHDYKLVFNERTNGWEILDFGSVIPGGHGVLVKRLSEKELQKIIEGVLIFTSST